MKSNHRSPSLPSLGRVLRAVTPQLDRGLRLRGGRRAAAPGYEPLPDDLDTLKHEIGGAFADWERARARIAAARLSALRTSSH